MFSGPNTNTNTIRFQKFGRIRIRILFGFRNMAEYEYKYYSGSEIWPNTNTNTIRVWKIMRIRIRIYSVLKNYPNTNTNSIRFENICRIRIRISLFGLNYSNTIRIPNYSLTSVMMYEDIPFQESLYHKEKLPPL